MKEGPLLPILQRKNIPQKIVCQLLNNVDEIGKESCGPKRRMCMT